MRRSDKVRTRDRGDAMNDGGRPAVGGDQQPNKLVVLEAAPWASGGGFMECGFQKTD